MKNKKLETALYFEKFGFSIIALMPNSKKPRDAWKVRQTVRMTEDEIRRHWMKYPNDNIGIVTGEISDLVVYDCDSEEAVKDFEDFLGGKPDTYIVKTSHGAHYYFRYPKGKVCRNRAGIIPGLDIRGEGGYVVAPGSIHPDGHVYLAERPLEMGIAEFPVEIFELGKAKSDDSDKADPKELLQNNEKAFAGALKSKGISLGKWAKNFLNGVHEGSRNDAMARLAGTLFSKGIDYDTVVALLTLWNQQNIPPLGAKEVITTIDSIWKRHKTKVEAAKEQAVLKNLEIIGVDEKNRTVFFSKDTQVTHNIKLPQITFKEMIQIAGEEFLDKVSLSGNTTDGKISFEDWKNQTILQARARHLENFKHIGQGVWRTRGEEFLIVNGKQALIYDGHTFQKHDSPIYEDYFLNLSRTKKWIDDDIISLTANLTCESAVEIINELSALLRQWNFGSSSNYALLEGFIISRFVQGIWQWRPHMWLSGPAGCGKSKLIELIDAISGPLSLTQQGKVTEAGIRQNMLNNLFHVNIDEFEKTPQRDRIIELLRSANRGGDITKGTPSGVPIHFHVRHMFLVASIEVGLAREAERTRFIIVEWRKDSDCNPSIPSFKEMETLRKKITAVALWSAPQALKMLSEVKTYKDIEARMLETFAVPLVFRVIAEGGSFGDLIERTVSIVKEKHAERPLMLSDTEQLLVSIAQAIVFVNGGKRVVSELLNEDSHSNEELARLGIKIVDSRNEEGDRLVYLVPDMVAKEILAGTKWQHLNIGDILIRCPKAKRSRRRVAGNNARGVQLPLKYLLGEYVEE